MKQFTTRSPCLTLTHSRWRGDFSSRALAQSWAVAVTAASMVATRSRVTRFMGFLFGLVYVSVSATDFVRGVKRACAPARIPWNGQNVATSRVRDKTLFGRRSADSLVRESPCPKPMEGITLLFAALGKPVPLHRFMPDRCDRSDHPSASAECWRQECSL